MECVGAIGREYETSALQFEQLPNGSAEIFAEFVEEETVCTDYVVEAALQITVVGVLAPLQQAAFDGGAKLVIATDYFEIFEAVFIAVCEKYLSGLAASAYLRTEN